MTPHTAEVFSCASPCAKDHYVLAPHFAEQEQLCIAQIVLRCAHRRDVDRPGLLEELSWRVRVHAR